MNFKEYVTKDYITEITEHAFLGMLDKAGVLVKDVKELKSAIDKTIAFFNGPDGDPDKLEMVLMSMLGLDEEEVTVFIGSVKKQYKSRINKP